MYCDLKQVSNITTISAAFKAVFKNSIFIVFSLVNLFIPFFATIMSALKGPNGAINAIGVGLATSFVTIFNQFLFLISMITFFVLNRNKETEFKCENAFYAIWLILLFYATIAAILFIATSFLYLHFSSIYWNINTASKVGYKYIGIIVPSLFFNTYIYLHLFRARNIHKWYGYVVILSLLALNLFFIPIIGLIPNWSNGYDSFGIGLGITISSLILFTIIAIFNFKKYIHSLHFDKRRLIFIIKKTKNFSLVFLLSTILKSILVMSIAISLGLSDKPTPPALMITKIIWYNSLFLVGWFADGLFYAIQYARIKNDKYNVEPNYKIWTAFILLATVVTLATSILFGYISMELPYLYISHQDVPILNPLNVNGMWPYGNLSANEIRDYLWSPVVGVANFSLDPIVTSSGITWQYSKTYALLYVTLYHVVVNATKIMGISDVEFNQKFNWKGLISNFILISLVMIFITTFSVAGSQQNETIKTIFPGIDAFSFSLLVIIAFLFILTLLSFVKAIFKQKKNKKIMHFANQPKFTLDQTVLSKAIEILPKKLEAIGTKNIPNMIYHLANKNKIDEDHPNFSWIKK